MLCCYIQNSEPIVFFPIKNTHWNRWPNMEIEIENASNESSPSLYVLFLFDDTRVGLSRICCLILVGLFAVPFMSSLFPLKFILSIV